MTRLIRQRQKNWRWCQVGKCDVILNFTIYGQFEAIRKPDAGRMVCKIYIFIKSNILSYKNWRHSSYTIALSKGGIFDKNVVFLHKTMLISAKLREPWDWTVYFLSLHTCVHLSTKCQVFSIILTSFRQCGVILIEISDFGFDVQVWPFVIVCW